MLLARWFEGGVRFLSGIGLVGAEKRAMTRSEVAKTERRCRKLNTQRGLVTTPLTARTNPNSGRNFDSRANYSASYAG